MPGAATLTNEDLDSALKNRQLFPVFQPRVALDRLAADGAEALLRWQHPSFGLLEPAVALPFLRDEGRLREVSHYMLREAIRACADWRRAGLDWTVSVNVSGTDLADGTLATVIALILDEFDLPGSALTLDLPETDLAERATLLLPPMANIRALGCGIALDCAPGDRKIQNLGQLPITELKLSGAGMIRFIQRTAEAGVGIMAERMAHAAAQGIRTTAVGLAHEATLWAVQRAGFSAVQGDYVCRAQPSHELARWERIWREAAQSLSGSSLGSQSPTPQTPEAPLPEEAAPAAAIEVPVEPPPTPVELGPDELGPVELGPVDEPVADPPAMEEAWDAPVEPPVFDAEEASIERPPLPEPASREGPMPRILAASPSPPAGAEKPAPARSEAPDAPTLIARKLPGIDKPVVMTVANPGREPLKLFRRRVGR